MDNPMGIAADIRFGVHHRLASLAAHIDKCITDYASGGLIPFDEDYSHVVNELRVVKDQLKTFLDAKERTMNTNQGG